VARPLLKGAPRRILVIKLSSIGDAAHTLPSVAALARRFPDSQIDWLAGPAAAPVASLLPCVSRVLVFDGMGAARGGRRSLGEGDLRGADGTASWPSPFAMAAHLRETRRQLAAGGYDLALDFQGLFRSTLFTLAAPRRAGRGRWPHLHRSVSMYDAATPHAIENTARLLAAVDASLEAGMEALAEMLAPISARLRTRGGELVRTHQLERPLVAWLPESRGAARSLPLVSVPAGLPGTHVLLGGAELGRAALPPGMVNLGGRLPLLDSVALALASDLVLGADTGPSHLAALLGARIVGCFGPTRPARAGLRGPYASTVGAACGGCERRRCPRAAACVGASVARALAMADEALVGLPCTDS